MTHDKHTSNKVVCNCSEQAGTPDSDLQMCDDARFHRFWKAIVDFVLSSQGELVASTITPVCHYSSHPCNTTPTFPYTQAPLRPHPAFITISEEQMQEKKSIRGSRFLKFKTKQNICNKYSHLIFKQNKQLVRKAEIEDGL